MNNPKRFAFFEYLHADLSRARQLKGFGVSSKSSLTCWLGIFSPRFAPVLLCRLSHLLYLYKLTPIAKAVSLINFFLFGLEVGIRCEIGKGLFFPHTSGIVIGAFSIGNNVTIYQGVTIGARELDFSYLESSRPIIGSDVTISTGAVILGPIQIGDRVVVGANSVVLSPIPAGALAVGAPARIVRTSI
jgi:serine O-acetyltransferase